MLRRDSLSLGFLGLVCLSLVLWWCLTIVVVAAAVVVVVVIVAVDVTVIIAIIISVVTLGVCRLRLLLLCSRGCHCG